ncbi:trehalose synthase [Corynebacterium sp. Marseille-P4321]|uniref:trehalose synthase n=1 Tax=Corynebacterium sp. Marseille-P4321 TaxID=2736603 RepID=UPI00158E8A33|nr:trehalose synthase [Corynebacterium sp. Marseille-P4321]
MRIEQERFYGAKSEPVDATEVVAREQVGEFEWQLLDVTHGDVTDTYQVLTDGSRDVLATDAGARAYARHFAGLDDARPLGAEQSNTTLVVEGELLKVYRRLEGGLNPEIELLSRIGDCPHVAAVTGTIERGGRTVAMLQERIDGGVDGFDLATAGEVDADDARELGAALRRVHAALKDAFGTERVDVAKQLLRNLASYGEAVGDYAARVRELYEGLGEVEVQRVHGDAHLGQTLRTADRWYLVDFEGEPARPLRERRRPDHVLRDVAGMVRSFGYARAVGGFDEEWERERVEALLDGYGAEHSALLRAYVVDKACYEVVYERNNRPEWVEIPLNAVKTLL